MGILDKLKKPQSAFDENWIMDRKEYWKKKFQQLRSAKEKFADDHGYWYVQYLLYNYLSKSREKKRWILKVCALAPPSMGVVVWAPGQHRKSQVIPHLIDVYVAESLA